MEETAETAVLSLPDGRKIDLPFRKDHAGNSFLDIRALHANTGVCTFDPGYVSTGSCTSTITYIDGSKGCLLYRGPVLTSAQGMMSVTWWSKVGTAWIQRIFFCWESYPANPKSMHSQEIKAHTMVHEQLIQFYRGFLHGAHPMALMVGVVGALSAFYPRAADVGDPGERLRACMRLIAKMPTLAAIAYKTSIGQPLVYPRNDMSYSGNLLHMLFAVPTERYEVEPVLEKALETILILHMDHEQNASTSTVRTAGSSQANPFACIASGIAALWGPAHGGANEAVLKMLQEIRTPANIPKALARAKDKTDSYRLMGFGHRVYKNYDPRAKIMRRVCHEVLDHLKIRNDTLLEVAMKLEEAALGDEYFVKRNLFPNVDFYSGIVLRAMGIPVSMFTVLFAVARTVGWVSQWKEMVEEPVPRISRPRQAYMGSMQREFVQLQDRQSDGNEDAEMPETDADDAHDPSKRHLTKLMSAKFGQRR